MNDNWIDELAKQTAISSAMRYENAKDILNRIYLFFILKGFNTPVSQTKELFSTYIDNYNKGISIPLSQLFNIAR